MNWKSCWITRDHLQHEARRTGGLSREIARGKCREAPAGHCQAGYIMFSRQLAVINSHDLLMTIENSLKIIHHTSESFESRLQALKPIMHVDMDGIFIKSLSVELHLVLQYNCWTQTALSRSFAMLFYF
jgi:hypothetical protein